MKVLLIVNDFPSADNSYSTNIFVKEQVRAMSKLVDEINVIVPLPKGIELKRKISYQDYNIEENIHVYFVKYINPLFPLAYSKLRREWIWAESRAVMRFINKEGIKFDILHAHYTWPSGAVGIKLKETYNVPLVITEHTSQTLKKFLEKKDPLIFNTWKRSEAIIRVRKGDIYLISQAIDGKTPVFYVPNGFDGEKFKIVPKKVAREILDLPLDKKIILNVAQMYSPIKGHEILIRSFSKVLEKQENVLLVLIGNGKLLSKIESLIYELNVQDHVILRGSRPHDEIPLWMNAADIFVLPSLSEGNPTVMFEALGVGLPFVGTTVGGIPEIITSDEYGLLCPPRDTECLVKKILIALNQEWDRNKIRKYAEQFAWERIARQVMEIYNKLYNGDFDEKDT